MGNLGEVFNLVIGKFGRSPNELNTCAPMAVSIEIAKFKLCQYQWRAISPNLMLQMFKKISISFIERGAVLAVLQIILLILI